MLAASPPRAAPDQKPVDPARVQVVIDLFKRIHPPFTDDVPRRELIGTAPMLLQRQTRSPRIPESDADGRTLRASPALVQPLASDEVAAALADIATAPPRNRRVEFAGPECFRLDEILQRVMRAIRDPREVVTDPSARYYGAPLSEDTLTPDEGAIIGVGTFDDWFKHSSNSTQGLHLRRESTALNL